MFREEHGSRPGQSGDRPGSPAEWSPGTRAKAVLSQTLFANLNTLPPGGSSGSATARGAFPDPDDLPTSTSFFCVQEDARFGHNQAE